MPHSASSTRMQAGCVVQCVFAPVVLVRAACLVSIGLRGEGRQGQGRQVRAGSVLSAATGLPRCRGHVVISAFGFLLQSRTAPKTTMALTRSARIPAIVSGRHNIVQNRLSVSHFALRCSRLCIMFT